MEDLIGSTEVKGAHQDEKLNGCYADGLHPEEYDRRFPNGHPLHVQLDSAVDAGPMPLLAGATTMPTSSEEKNVRYPRPVKPGISASRIAKSREIRDARRSSVAA